MAQAKSIFNFLKAYNELSNPVITELANQKWSLNISDLPPIQEIKSIFSSEDVESLKVLEVIKPVLKACPSPGEALFEWLGKDWRKLSVEDIPVKEVITREILDEVGNKSYLEERFEESKERVNAYEKWIVLRKQWREAELPREQGLNLYNNLFKLYSDMKKEIESVELILGDGILVWHQEARNIQHPVLLQKVRLEFDPLTPAFRVRCDEIKTEIYTPMLRIIPTINQQMLSDLIQEAEENNYSIADLNNTVGLFKRMIHIIDEKGSFLEGKVTASSEARIFSNPVLFLRKRTLGYSTFIEGIIEEISSKGEEILPGFFEVMSGNYKESRQTKVLEDNWNHNGIDQDILLTLPANNEQLRIIKCLNQYGAVLVQGPPGTGKTHTIANLIGHLLSQGKSVLVTSHTEKALSVLKDKVYKDPLNKDLSLQSLCISLLSSKSQKKEMDEAINEIAEKGTSLNPTEAKSRILRLEKERENLIQASKDKSNELLRLRSLEYKDIVYNNQTISPIEAAKFIKSGAGSFDYLKGPTLDETVGLPLSHEELNFLFQSNETITAQEEAVLAQEVPNLAALWKPQEFAEKSRIITQLENELQAYSHSDEFQENVAEVTIRELKNNCSRILEEIKGFESLHQSIINKSIVDVVYPKLWLEVLQEFDQLMKSYERVSQIELEEDYDITQALQEEDSLTTLKEILESGKETPVMWLTALKKPKWKKLKESISNNGKVIENRKDFLLAYELISYLFAKKTVLKKAQKLIPEESFGSDLTGNTFEVKMKRFRNEILVALSWYEKRWLPFIAEYNRQVRVPIDFARYLNLQAPLSSILNFINSNLDPKLKKAMIYFNYGKVKAEREHFSQYLTPFQSSSSFVDELISAIKHKDSKVYQASYNALADILSHHEIYKQRTTLLSKLKSIAPDWAKALETREGIHGQSRLPENIDQAWKWCQLSNQISRLDAMDPDKIQKELEEINQKLRLNAQRLAYEKAWLEVINNRTQEQAQAIEGWRTTIRQIGKGTGKDAPILMKKARDLMPRCQSAIPVWIMPLNRVVENFDPRNNKFDVVIIDEASQSDILALSALYLGKKTIIVGDDEQVSPDSVGLSKNEINALIAQYLQDIPNNHLFNGQTSLYDMAKSSGFKPLMLTEHFRCLPEIIGFSNHLSYNGRIKPLRDASNVKVRPPVVEHRVPAGCKNDNKVNEAESEHIASLVCACVEMEEYAGKSMGVISLLGVEQSYEIDCYLQMYLNPLEYESRKIQCGTPPQFQGDERDVIFLSVVEGPREKGGPVRLLSEDGNNDKTRKRYNVAASRAKDQMWVVHSLNPEIDLKPDDIRLRLIKHAMNPNTQEDEQRLSAAESPFETEVMTILLNNGYRVIPQVKVGFYRIDMVIEDGDKRIALECDGEKWHTQDDLPNDLKRQAILERMGWTFIRIRGSAFYRDPEATMKEVIAKLEIYGLHPNYSLDIQPDIKADGLIDRVKRRAIEIRQNWHRVEGEDEADGEGETKIIDKADTVDKGNEEVVTTEEEIDKEEDDTDMEAKVNERKDAVEIEEKIDENERKIKESAPLNIKKHRDQRKSNSHSQAAQAVSTVKSKRRTEFRQLEFTDLLSNKEEIAKPRYDFRNQTVRPQSDSSVIKENKIDNLVENGVSGQVKQERRYNQKPLFDFRNKN
ncbi:MAG: AAA domain-containing protein [Desulfitobacterium sp.]